MTVCIAAMFMWNYGDSENIDLGPAIVTASDRMITSGDIQYEPPNLKISFLTRRTLVLAAGEIPVHSAIIGRVAERIAASQDESPGKLAALYADALVEVRAEESARVYLGPLMLSLSDFVQGRHGLNSNQVSELTAQMQQHNPPFVEALIVGSDDISTHIFSVDQYGAHCQSDVGFAAIGTGAPQAKLHFMRTAYSRRSGFSTALATAYAAKKIAQIAAGVGSQTDMFFVNRIGWSGLDDAMVVELQRSYEEVDLAKRKLDELNSSRIQEFIDCRRVAVGAGQGIVDKGKIANS